MGLHPLILFDVLTPIFYVRRDAFRDVSQSVAEEMLGQMRGSLAFGLNVWAAIMNERTSSRHSNSLIMNKKVNDVFLLRANRHEALCLHPFRPWEK